MPICTRKVDCKGASNSFLHNTLKYEKPDRVNFRGWATDEYGDPYLKHYEGIVMNTFEKFFLFHQWGCPAFLTISYEGLVEMTLTFND